MTRNQHVGKFAIILHADIAGSTKLVQLNEQLAHERFQASFRQLGEVIRKHQGQVRELRGDALLADFERASDAVAAAVEFQTAHGEKINCYVDAIRPVLRIGIAMGEVIIADNTVTGTGVILAQRLEQLAEPGGVVIQGAVYETIPKRFEFKCRNLGDRNLKGFDETVRAYSVELGDEPSKASCINSTAAPGDSIAAGKPSIAVLPFTNMSGDPEQEYFSDGITEDLITALSLFRSFPVIARNSVFTYKGQAIRVQQVAEELGVRYLIEGGIRKAGQRLRITAQLIDAATGHHVWAAKYDRKLDDIFEIQDEITQKIVMTIQPELIHAELERTAVKRPESLSAWDLYLRGMGHLDRHTDEDYQAARRYFRQAIELDPGYSDAWASLALSYLYVNLNDVSKRGEITRQGMDAAKRAVELDTRSSYAHYVLGMAYVWKEQLQAAIQEGEFAIELNPNYAQARMGLGNRLELLGRSAEGIEMMEQSMQLNPRDPTRPIFMCYLSRAYLSFDQADKALEWIERALSLRPDSATLLHRHAICLASLDRPEEAESALRECERLRPGFIQSHQDWRPYSDDDRNRRFFAGMIRHGLMDY